MYLELAGQQSGLIGRLQASVRPCPKRRLTESFWVMTLKAMASTHTGVPLCNVEPQGNGNRVLNCRDTATTEHFILFYLGHSTKLLGHLRSSRNTLRGMWPTWTATMKKDMPSKWASSLWQRQQQHVPSLEHSRDTLSAPEWRGLKPLTEIFEAE